MKIKTKEKDVPIAELKIELTRDDIQNLNNMGPELKTEGSSYYEDYTYKLNLDIETKEQADLINQFIDIVHNLDEKFL